MLAVEFKDTFQFPGYDTQGTQRLSAGKASSQRPEQSAGPQFHGREPSYLFNTGQLSNAKLTGELI